MSLLSTTTIDQLPEAAVDTKIAAETVQFDNLYTTS
jgi:hypothetical protein